MLVEELVQKPSGLLSIISDKQPSNPPLSRHMLTTRRCYCILSRLPFFELHFGVLNRCVYIQLNDVMYLFLFCNVVQLCLSFTCIFYIHVFTHLTFWLISYSIFTEERLDRLTKGITGLDFESPEDYSKEENIDENTEETSDSVSVDDRATEDMLNGSVELAQLKDSEPVAVTDDGGHLDYQMLEKDIDLLKTKNNDMITAKRNSSAANGEDSDIYVDDVVINKQAVEKRFPNAVLPLLRHYQYESSESSSR